MPGNEPSPEILDDMPRRYQQRFVTARDGMSMVRKSREEEAQRILREICVENSLSVDRATPQADIWIPRPGAAFVAGRD